MALESPEPSPSPFGVYVHVPFCRHRCDYCAFATYTDRDHLMKAYASACVTELVRAVEREGMPPATSVFFGGGTPSRLPADLLADILDAVGPAPGAEVTVECNPEDATARSPPTGPPASPGCRSECSRWCRTCSPAWGAATAPQKRGAPWRSPPRRASCRGTSTSSSAAPARPTPTWERSLDGRARASSRRPT